MRARISSGLRLLMGWGSSTYGWPSMPLLLNWNTQAFRNACVMMTVDGMPRFSNSIVSCTLHNVQDPHPPTAAAATVPTVPPPPRVNWLLFFALLLSPPLLTVLSVWCAGNKSGLSVAVALLGGAAGGIASGALLGRGLGSRTETRIVLGLVCARLLKQRAPADAAL